MKLSLFSAAAFAAPLIAGSPVHSNDSANATVATHALFKPVAKPTPVAHWSTKGCHEVCSSFPGYDICMNSCCNINNKYPKRSVHDVTDDEVEDSPNDRVVENGKVADEDIITKDETLEAHFKAMMSSIKTYGGIYDHLNNMNNKIERPEFPWALGNSLDDYLQAWLNGFKNTLGNADSPAKWYDELYNQVKNSKVFTARFYARRFEVVARKDTELEMKEMTKGLSRRQRAAIRASVRQGWAEAFGRPAWGPRLAMASIDHCAGWYE